MASFTFPSYFNLQDFDQKYFGYTSWVILSLLEVGITKLLDPELSFVFSVGSVATVELNHLCRMFEAYC